MRRGLPPPGDRHDRPGDAGGGVREQPEHGLRHLVHGAGAADRRPGAHPLRAVGVAGGGVDPGPDHARRDGVHADALPRDLPRRADRHRVHRALARRVVHPLPAAARPRGHGRDRHDRPALLHAPDRVPGEQEGAGDVDRQHAVERGAVELRRAPLAAGDAGIGGRAVHGAGPCGGVEPCGDMRRVGGVARRRDHPAGCGQPRRRPWRNRRRRASRARPPCGRWKRRCRGNRR